MKRTPSPRAPSTTWPRRVLFRALAFLFGLLVLALPAEIVLRFMPVIESTRRTTVDANDPVLRFAPDRDVVWSKGWRMTGAVRKHVNNAGFFSSLDYVEASPLPLVAVVGDSYIEALMVPHAQTLPGRLGALLGAGVRVYAFGASGAPLSQYLAYAGFARDRYRPDRLIVLVVGNDFDESLEARNPKRGHHLFREGEHGDLQWVRRDAHTKLQKRVYRESALIRYLLGNVEIEAAPGRLMEKFAGADPDRVFVGNTLAQADPERVRDSVRVIDAFLDSIPEHAGLPPVRILFVIDGMRPQLYDAPDEDARMAASESYFGRMRREFIREATGRGHPVVDMQPIFTEHHRRHGERFEFADDGHWNGLAHELAARAVLATGFLAELSRIDPGTTSSEAASASLP